MILSNRMSEIMDLVQIGNLYGNDGWFNWAAFWKILIVCNNERGEFCGVRYDVPWVPKLLVRGTEPIYFLIFCLSIGSKFIKHYQDETSKRASLHTQSGKFSSQVVDSSMKRAYLATA